MQLLMLIQIEKRMSKLKRRQIVIQKLMQKQIAIRTAIPIGIRILKEKRIQMWKENLSLNKMPKVKPTRTLSLILTLTLNHFQIVKLGLTQMLTKTPMQRRIPTVKRTRSWILNLLG